MDGKSNVVSVTLDARRRLRILYVCPLAHLVSHLPYAAVSETAALAKANQDVTLLTFAPLQYVAADPNVKLFHALGSENKNLRRLLRPALDHRRHPRIALSLAFLLTLLEVQKLRRKTRFDVIHIRDGDDFMPLVQVFGILFGGGRWLISLLRVYERPFVLNAAFESAIGALIYRLSLSRTRYGYVCSNQHDFDYYSERFMSGLFSKKVFLLHPIVPKPLRFPGPQEIADARANLGITQGQQVLLSFGVLHPGKDVETLLSAMDAIPEAVLVHAGPTYGRLKELSKMHQRLRIIVNDSFIPEDSKPVYFGLASAVILSYTRKFTSTASNLWEACRYQVPVIASSNEQMTDLVSRYNLGVIFEAQDSGSLEGAIRRFLAFTPQERNELKRNCERFSDEFSSARWAANCRKIYEELCDRQSEG